MTHPDHSILPESNKRYVDRVKDLDLMDALDQAHREMDALLQGIPEPQAGFRYAAEKWSIREVIAHVIDSERIFAYRALRFARTDGTPLAGYDEKVYGPEANAEGRTLKDLRSELEHVHQATVDLFRSFTPEMMTRSGTANQTRTTVANIGFMIAGHELHHVAVLTERYLNAG